MIGFKPKAETGPQDRPKNLQLFKICLKNWCGRQANKIRHDPINSGGIHVTELLMKNH